MTLQEFKAWFDGFTEEMAGASNKKQWYRIKKRVKEIDGTAVSYPVYVDRYVPYIRRYADYIPYWNAAGCNMTAAQGVNSRYDGHEATSFNSTSAMLALGKADYQSIS